MLNINPGRKKLILSIDGGGMRGMIAAAMLAELETLTGKASRDLFDMVAGTSTGAIIAAGIALGFSAQDMVELVYRTRLPEAFRRQPRGLLLWLRYLLGGLRHLYDLQPFVEVLGPLGRGKKIRDLQKPILLLTTKDLRTGSTYFVVSKGPGAAAFADWPVVGAVAASGAAPIYFPPVLRNLIDGGAGVYGNPCLAATIEAMEFIGATEGFNDGNVIHLSLGTGYTSSAVAEGAGARFWLYNWLRYLINEGLIESSLQQVISTQLAYRSRVDFRRYNPFLNRQSITDQLGISLVNRPDPEQLGLDSFEPEQLDLMEEIGRRYAQKVDWTLENYAPWNPDDPMQGRDGGHPLPGIQPVNWVAPYL